ncbi:GNAT family N-acetyltransferase [Candidatus Leptofilum sp.]|uniref:GNAT family N-acetyltransferase n=1 Tax=Candidatus Leptofilum sp. TaxID=3241576 RepID=UPI003B598831
MCYELELTKINRLKIADAFQNVPRVDMSIPCVVEGQMGQAFVDDLAQPTIHHVVIGPFHYFAGCSDTPQAQAMMAEFPAYNLLMPSSPGWAELARQQFGDALRTNNRHSFSSESLAADHLNKLVNGSSFEGKVVRIDTAVAHKLSTKNQIHFGLADFDSAEDFATRGLGFVAMVGEQPVGIAYSSLVCSQGIEVSIFVDEAHRWQGIATLVGANLLLACLNRNLHPNWDAANPESVKLAEKLGYRSTGSYKAHFHTQKS